MALGQFLAHPRSTSLISGPRSVVATFRRAALHYRSTGTPYTIFDFCDDYLRTGTICYNQQEIDNDQSLCFYPWSRRYWRSRDSTPDSAAHERYA